MMNHDMPKGKPLLTEDEIDSITKCLKYIPTNIGKAYHPSSMRPDNGQYRRRIELICDEYRLTMVLRQLIDNPLDFSVLLIFDDEKGHTYIIKRYNGDHGLHIDNRTGICISGPHIHTITEEHQRSYHKDEGHAEPTNKYKTLPEAVDVFMKDLNIHYGTKGVTTLDEF